MPKKILLVEDDSAILDIYTTVLKKGGFEVESCSLGQDVVKKLQKIESKEESRPDLVLLDLILPDMNGMEVLSQVRKNKAAKGITVFILSNQEQSQIEIPADAKPDKFIIKANITPTQLVELVRKELD